MGRRVVSDGAVAVAREQGRADGKETTTLQEQVLYSIPAESIAAWIAIENLLRAGSSTPDDPTWSATKIGLFALVVVLTPYYVWLDTDTPVSRLSRLQLYAQLTLATIAFPVWVYSLDGTLFGGTPDYTAAGIVLLLYTLLPPLVYRSIDRFAGEDFSRPVVVDGKEYSPKDLNDDGNYSDVDGDGRIDDDETLSRENVAVLGRVVSDE